MAASGDSDLKAAYADYCSKPNMMTTKDFTKWLDNAGLLKKTGKFSSNSIDICFSKHKTKGKNCVTFDQAKCIIKDSAGDDNESVCCKMATCRKGDHLHAKTSKTGNVGGLTDASKYTGAHKERFDAEGKGKGAGGRTDQADSSGYVGNYKGSGSYGKK